MSLLLRKTLFIAAATLIALYGVVGVPTSRSNLLDNLHRNIHLGLDLRGGVSFILRVKTEAAPAAQRHGIMEQTRRVLDRRINPLGVSETAVQAYGSRGDELLVQVPEVRDTARIRHLLESRTVLEWYAVQEGPFATEDAARAEHAGILPADTRLVATVTEGVAKAQSWYLLTGPPVIHGSDLRDAHVTAADSGGPVTTFSLVKEAAGRFERYTQANIGKRAAIVLDDRILSVPVIHDVIRDSGQIQGARSLEQAQDLALSLRSGALPAGVEILEQRTVEPGLGADSIGHGIRAGLAGLSAVVAAMLVYYRKAGANAVLALLLNALLLLAALSYFGAVLTLPGIAGVILTIGMAVDSNVLIFERIREEIKAGRTSVAAIAVGFSRAFGTLVDTHVTTIVSCAFLFLFGTPAIKGFAVTLSLGLIVSLFTSVFVSKVAFDWEMRRKETESLSI